MLPDSKEATLGSSNQEVFPLAGKNTKVLLRTCSAWVCFPKALSIVVDIPKCLRCHLLRQMNSHRGFQKLLQRCVSSQLRTYFSDFPSFLRMKRSHIKFT